MRRPSKDPNTLAVHAGDRKKPADCTPVSTPIHTASSFFYDAVEELEEAFEERRPGSVYTRFGNPTTGAFEEQIAALENADFGQATSSGMSALHLAISAATTDRRRSIVAGNSLYGQTMAMLTKVLEPQGLEVRFADAFDPEKFEETVAEARPAAILLETITNPLLRVPDLERLVEIARRHDALTIVDATFTTPVMLRPLDLGVDLVVHSITKYIAGHGDVLGGMVLGRDELQPVVRYLARTVGAVLGPFESFLALRGAKTLPLRFERQCANARILAGELAAMEGVERVYFPGDPAHPDHEIACRLFPDGMFGAVVTFDLEGGRERALGFINGLEMAVPATSVGDVHTMALYPPMSTHRDLSPKHRQRLGIGEGIVRFSVGCEGVDDIVADVRQAVAKTIPAPVGG